MYKLTASVLTPKTEKELTSQMNKKNKLNSNTLRWKIKAK